MGESQCTLCPLTILIKDMMEEVVRTRLPERSASRHIFNIKQGLLPRSCNHLLLMVAC
jgi:hypothetical protein